MLICSIIKSLPFKSNLIFTTSHFKVKFLLPAVFVITDLPIFEPTAKIEGIPTFICGMRSPIEVLEYKKQV